MNRPIGRSDFYNQEALVWFQAILMYVPLTFGCIVLLSSMAAQAALRNVNCDAGDTIQGALPDLKSGDTVVVNGTCSVNGNLTIPPDMVNVIFEGNGTASIRASNIVVLGREITVRGFDIAGGRNGINVFRGGTAVIEGNTIHDSGGSGQPGTGLGINVAQHSFASIINNTIRNNVGNGISVIEGSAARIGYIDNLVNSLPNVVEGNGGNGVTVGQNAVANIVGATITGSGLDGILVRLGSRATIANNTISRNRGNGVTVVDSSSAYFEFAGVPQANRTDADSPNLGFGVSCAVGGSVSKALGTLTGLKGAVDFDPSCVDNLTR